MHCLCCVVFCGVGLYRCYVIALGLRTCVCNVHEMARINGRVVGCMLGPTDLYDVREMYNTAWVMHCMDASYCTMAWGGTSPMYEFGDGMVVLGAVVLCTSRIHDLLVSFCSA
jgi:hypothetical protein